MKKVLLSLAFMLIGSFAFADSGDINKVSKESIKLNLSKTSSVNADGLIVKSCTYDIIDVRTLKKIGEITVTDVPNMLPCDDKKLMSDVTAYINSLD